MTVPLYTDIYKEAERRPEYYKGIAPREAALKLTDHPYRTGTYLISRGLDLCEIIFSFVHHDRRILQLSACLIYDVKKYYWIFKNQLHDSVNELIITSGFLLHAYTPLLKIPGFVPALLGIKLVPKEEGDYFIVNNMHLAPWTLEIFRYSKENNQWSLYRVPVEEGTDKLPSGIKGKFRLRKPLCL